ncbi:hypothetical protein Cni_G10264 [Canna indica]|uniref:Uncharacterized protein n=1 Tax=Canna indica TaxID=4628 RepID=A0AAQ3K7F7_9LILI|nr:hypothetical protein Cni_G10264 [Canna indica]
MNPQTTLKCQLVPSLERCLVETLVELECRSAEARKSCFCQASGERRRCRTRRDVKEAMDEEESEATRAVMDATIGHGDKKGTDGERSAEYSP